MSLENHAIMWKARKTHQITVEVSKPCWEGYRYGFDIQAHGRTQSGHAGEAETKQELYKHCRSMFEQWEKGDYDHPKPAKLKPKDVFLLSFTPDITVEEMFGNNRIDSETMTAPPCPVEEALCTLASRRSWCRSKTNYREYADCNKCPNKAACDNDLILEKENPEELKRLIEGAKYKKEGIKEEEEKEFCEETKINVTTVEKIKNVGLERWF